MPLWIAWVTLLKAAPRLQGNNLPSQPSPRLSSLKKCFKGLQSFPQSSAWHTVKWQHVITSWKCVTSIPTGNRQSQAGWLAVSLHLSLHTSLSGASGKKTPLRQWQGKFCLQTMCKPSRGVEVEWDKCFRLPCKGKHLLEQSETQRNKVVVYKGATCNQWKRELAVVCWCSAVGHR